MHDHPLLRRLPASRDCSSDTLLEAFLSYVGEKKLELYPAQEEAILELFEGKNVILNTPTGSGKSLVAAAMHFRALALGRRSVYTCPIKALVNEKFLALCKEFGPDNVGMATGDATVNRDAPILCCTAEILANYALRDGPDAPFRDVIMDEFHYYSDRERGVAWQVPLLTMSNARFLLMSATMGGSDFFKEKLSTLTKADTTIVAAYERPVPLEFSYVETSVDVTLQSLVEANKAPIYLVHFGQNDASQAAQDLMSLNFCSPAEKASIKDLMAGMKFTSPYGKEVKKYLGHGVGIHHAGLLPKYRVLVESLAQKGLLKVICGTDTLGVGVNVPIRTVVLTRLSKYGGSKVALLPSRDFHQITGRAGRRGFDDIGYVVAQAPEHHIENLKMEAKAAGDVKKARKLVKKKPPDGFVGWSEETFAKLQRSTPEPLVSRFQMSHGLLLNVLSRRGDACAAMQKVIEDSHETTGAKKSHKKRGWQLFKSLVAHRIVEIIPVSQRDTDGTKLRLNVELQDDFSLNHALSLYLINTIKLIDPESANYVLDVMTLCESILEDPDIVLRRQLDAAKNEAVAAMKANGVPYEERMEKLEGMEYPKPCREFIYSTFNAFASEHPWVGSDNIKPKSIAREMFENYRSFNDYVNDYDLHRVEGVLLRHLSSAYKVLAQTVPEAHKTEPVQEMEAWLAGVLRGTDSSLLDEWERLRDPNYKPGETEETIAQAPDITRNKREFTALIRTEIFRFLRPLAQENYPAAVASLSGSTWTADALAQAIDPFFATHDRIRLDPEARNGRHTYVDATPTTWKVSQVIVDGDEQNDWQLQFSVDVAQAREEGKPTLVLLSVGPVVE
jgi:superfamily II RNA helicase